MDGWSSFAALLLLLVAILEFCLLVPGWDYIMKAALGPAYKPGSPPQHIAKQTESALTLYLQALAFKQPSALLVQSLLGAIKAGSVSAVITLLRNSADSLAGISERIAMEHKMSCAIFLAVACLQDAKRRTSMVETLTSAFQQQQRQDLLLHAAVPAIVFGNADLLQWQLVTGIAAWTRSDLRWTLCYAVQYGRLSTLQQLLAIPGPPWHTADLWMPVSKAAQLGKAAYLQLLLAACPHWFELVLARVLQEAATAAVAAQLLGAADGGWRAWQLEDVVTALAKAGSVDVLALVLEAPPKTAAAGGWQSVHLALGVLAAVKNKTEVVLAQILAANVESWQPGELRRAVFLAVRAGNAAILQQLLEAGKGTWKPQQLAAVVLEVCQQGGDEVILLLLLMAVAGGWRERDLVAAAVEAVAAGRTALMQELLEPCHVKQSHVWKQKHLSPIVLAAVRTSNSSTLWQVLAAAGKLGVKWELACLSEALLEAVKGAGSGGADANDAAAAAADAADAVIFIGGEGSSSNSMLRELLAVMDLSKYQKQRMHVLPAISEAIRRRDIAAAGLLLGAAGGAWRPQELGQLLLEATAVQSVWLARVVLRAGGDWWHPSDIAPSVAEAAWRGAGKQQQLLQLLVGAVAGRWESVHLAGAMQGAAAAAGAAPAGVNGGFGASGGHAAGDVASAACGVLKKLLEVPLTVDGYQWETQQLQTPLQQAVQCEDIELVAKVLRVVKIWTAAELLEFLGAAMRHRGDVALKLLQLIQAAAQGQWLEEQLTPLLDAALATSQPEIFRELLRAELAYPGWSREVMTEMLMVAVGRRDAGFMEALLQLPGVEWECSSVQGALKAAIKQDDARKVLMLLGAGLGPLGWERKGLERLVTVAEIGGHFAAAAAIRGQLPAAIEGEPQLLPARVAIIDGNSRGPFNGSLEKPHDAIAGASLGGPAGRAAGIRGFALGGSAAAGPLGLGTRANAAASGRQRPLPWAPVHLLP